MIHIERGDGSVCFCNIPWYVGCTLQLHAPRLKSDLRLNTSSDHVTLRLPFQHTERRKMIQAQKIWPTKSMSGYQANGTVGHIFVMLFQGQTLIPLLQFSCSNVWWLGIQSHSPTIHTSHTPHTMTIRLWNNMSTEMQQNRSGQSVEWNRVCSCSMREDVSSLYTSVADTHLPVLQAPFYICLFHYR